jgi:predicted DNA-binding transcriptional regulator AlpA
VKKAQSDDSKLTVAYICADLDISRRTFYEWRAKGKAPACIHLPNGELRVERSEYRRWLDELATGAA